MIDTGPLVALLRPDEPDHTWADETVSSAPLETSLWTCEAVLVEACFLLHRAPGAEAALLELLSRKVVTIHFQLAAELEPVRKLMAKYADVPMSLADACLVRMTEIHTDSVLLTFDGGFRVYRRNGRQVIPIKSPSARD